jgi:hypothetical protein
MEKELKSIGMNDMVASGNLNDFFSQICHVEYNNDTTFSIDIVRVYWDISTYDRLRSYNPALPCPYKRCFSSLSYLLLYNNLLTGNRLFHQPYSSYMVSQV